MPSTHSAESVQGRNRFRAFGPGTGCVLAVLLVAVLVAGCGGSTSAYPSFLPKKTLAPQVDAALVGTEARPALQVEGLPVDVHTTRFDVRVVVSGPVVPGEGLPVQQAATTCTWTVTMDHATADVPVSGNSLRVYLNLVPVSAADFHSVDHLGSVFLMGLVPGEQTPPPVLHPGQTLTFRLRAYELTGEGMMQWAPDHEHVVGNWDYTVEND